MKLPHGDRAVVDLTKLVNYCLDPTHIRGRHKARVFDKALGITQRNPDLLREALLRAAVTGDATPTQHDAYGQRYVIDFFYGRPHRAGSCAQQLDCVAERRLSEADQLLRFVSH